MSPSFLRGMRRRLSGTRDLSRSLRGEGGSAIVEVAFVISIFGIPLLFGVTDLATWIYSTIEISNAAHAGVVYGMATSSEAGDTAGITTAAKNELAADFLATNVRVTPTIYYACSNTQGGTQYATEAAAASSATGGGNCPPGQANHVLEFLQVQVSAPLTLPFSCCGMTSPVTLTSISVMEVEQLPI